MLVSFVEDTFNLSVKKSEVVKFNVKQRLYLIDEDL